MKIGHWFFQVLEYYVCEQVDRSKMVVLYLFLDTTFIFLVGWWTFLIFLFMFGKRQLVPKLASMIYLLYYNNSQACSIYSKVASTNDHFLHFHFLSVGTLSLTYLLYLVWWINRIGWDSSYRLVFLILTVQVDFY